MSYNFNFGGFDVRDLPGHYESFSEIAEKMQAAISDPSVCVDHRGNLRIGVDRFYRVSPSDPQVLSFTIDLTGEAMSR